MANQTRQPYDSTALVIQAARSLNRALDESVEGALWLDRKMSARVYRARCRLARALHTHDARSRSAPTEPAAGATSRGSGESGR